MALKTAIWGLNVLNVLKMFLLETFELVLKAEELQRFLAIAHPLPFLSGGPLGSGRIDLCGETTHSHIEARRS